MLAWLGGMDDDLVVGNGDGAGQRLFISYTGTDSAWAEWIAWVLEGNGHDALIDRWDFGSGSHLIAELDRALDGSRRVVAVVSTAYLSSPAANAQWQAVWPASLADTRRRLLVFRIEDCEPTGLLGSITRTDLFGLDEEAARTRVLDAVPLARRKPATVPPFPGAGPSTEMAGHATGGTRPVFPPESPHDTDANDSAGDKVESDPWGDTVDRPRRLSWEAAEPVARQMLCVWTDGAELKWAAEAWRVLAPSGLTEYSTERERARCLVRALALGAIYRDFCSQAFSEGELDEWRYLLDVGELAGSRQLVEISILEQLASEVGIEAAEETAIEDDEAGNCDMDPDDAILALVVEEYPKVGSALRSEWGDSRLFATMILSCDKRTEYPLLSYEVSDQVNTDITFDKLRAWAWMTESL